MTAALLSDPYRKRPSMPMDLSWVDRSKPKPVEVSPVEVVAREALVRRGAADLMAMLFDPPRSRKRGA